MKPFNPPTPVTPRNVSATVPDSKKSMFTPCRRLGLNRKSMGSTPNTPSNTPNPALNQLDMHSMETPKKTVVQSMITEKSSSSVSTPLMLRDKILAPRKLMSHKKISIEPKECLENVEITEEILASLRERVSEKESQLAELKRKQMERKPESDLKRRTDVWRTGCQNALLQLHEKTKSLGHELTLSEVINQLKIPYDVIRFNPESEYFDDL